MIPVRRVKIKAAPNIGLMGSRPISKKTNTSVSVNKNLVNQNLASRETSHTNQQCNALSSDGKDIPIIDISLELGTESVNKSMPNNHTLSESNLEDEKENCDKPNSILSSDCTSLEIEKSVLRDSLTKELHQHSEKKYIGQGSIRKNEQSTTDKEVQHLNTCDLPILNNNEADVSIAGRICDKNTDSTKSKSENVLIEATTIINEVVVEKNILSMQDDLTNSSLCTDLVRNMPTSLDCENALGEKISNKQKKIAKSKCRTNLSKLSKKNNSKENINSTRIDEIDTNFSSGSSNFKNRSKLKNDSEEKKIFNERKLQFKQKLSQGDLEPSKMTMFDLIFWNPSTNPMARQREKEKPRRDSTSATAGVHVAEIRSRHASTATSTGSVLDDTRTSTVNEIDSNTSEALEEIRIEEDGLEPVDVAGITEKREEINKSTDIDADIEDDEVEESANVLAPQVKIGPDGELIIDEKSLLIQTTAAKNRDKILSNSEVVEENDNSSHYGKWSKRRKRATEWTKKETARFYKALSTVGTDFSLMATVFAWRTRAELKIKFKKEEKINRHLIDTALNDCTQFDFSIFDESDYDPEEDRKESKEAEKAEAKKRKELERHRRQQERKAERKIKKAQACSEKKRKKKLRELFCSRKRRKAKERVASPLNIVEESNESTAPSVVIEAQEVICEVVFVSPKKSYVENNVVTKHTDDSSESEDFSSVVTKKLKSHHENVVSHQKLFPETATCSNIMEVITFSEGDSMTITNSDSSPNISFLKCAPLEIIDINCTNSETANQSLTDNISENVTSDYIKSQMHSAIVSDSAISLESGSSFPVLPNTNSETNSSFLTTGKEEPACQNDKKIPAVSQICLPISCVKKNADGSQYVEINTANGLKKIEPVPDIPPTFSNIIVVVTDNPIKPSEQLFHVYFASPLNTNDQDKKLEPTQLSLQRTGS